MTTDMMSLRTLLEKSSDVDLLREMIGFAAERLMELEVGRLTGAGYGERAPIGSPSATDTAIAIWETRAGTVELRIPKLRKGSYFPASWSRAGWPRRRSPQSSRRPTSRASRPARSTNWSRRWG